MKRTIGILLALTLFLSCNQSVLAVNTEKYLPSEIAYDEIESTIDQYVEEHQATTAAMSVAVFTGDEIMMNKAYGFTDIENGIINDKDTVFEWGSCTKLITWASVMQLAEKGLINLDEDIRTYLPKDFLRKLKYDTPITMLNLMNHNAGWQETATDLFIEDKKDLKDLEEALRIIEPEQVNEPGTIVGYSNWNVALAGFIVERVSGQTFSFYVHDNIFAPLGMEHTALSADLSDNDWVYQKRMAQKCYTAENQSLGTCLNYISMYPAGFAVGTMEDFIKFAQAFLPKDKEASPLFEKRSTLDEMLSPSLYYGDDKTVRNYHGFWADQFKVSVLWHNGGTVGSSSWFTFDPVSGTGMIILTNQNNESIYNCGLLPFVFGEYEYTPAKASNDISGIYVTSRSCFKGYVKIYQLFTIMELSPKGDGSYTVPKAQTSIINLGGNSYLMNMGDLKQFFLYANIDSKGRTVLQNVATDYIQINGYGLLAKFGLVLLFIIAALYSLLMLITKLVCFLLHKTPKAMDKHRTLLNLASITSFALFVSIAIELMSSSTPLYQNIQWRLISCMILAVVPLISPILLLVKWRKLSCSKWNKISLIINALMGLIISINVYLWAI